MYSEWQRLEQFFPRFNRGRPRKWELWQIMNAILRVTRTGCQWRILPKNFLPWQTIYGYFWRWAKRGVWAEINAALVRQVRQQVGRGPEPSAAVVDCQSVEAPEGGEARGIDVYKQTPGRKGHIVVDTLDLVLVVVVHSASVQDRAGGLLILQALFDRVKHSVHSRWCRLKLIWAEGGYRDSVEVVRKRFGGKLEIVRRPEGSDGFAVLPRRWVGERTFGRSGRYRRLARDYEHTVASSEAQAYLASIRRMLKVTQS